MLLPHGYEGQGPEHSSARLERFLQLSAEHNWTVANVSTAAQYFHLLRRQAAILKMEEVKPLIVLTPKSMLRHSMTASPISELSNGSFQPFLQTTASHMFKEDVKKLVFSSGKIGVELTETLERLPDNARQNIHHIRIEELYPFPARKLQEIINYIGRVSRSSPAEGDPNVHNKEQERIITEALQFTEKGE